MGCNLDLGESMESLGTVTDGRAVEFDRSTGQYWVGGQPATAEWLRQYAGQVRWATPELAVHFGVAPAMTPAPPPSGPVAASSATPASAFAGWPAWAKVLFVLVYPVSIPYGIYRMWKTGRFTNAVRVGLTCLGALALVVGLAAFGSGSSAPDRVKDSPAAVETSASNQAAQEASAAAAAARAAEEASAAAAAARAAEEASAAAAAEHAAEEASAAAAQRAEAERAAAERVAAEKATAKKAAAAKAAAAAAAKRSSAGQTVYITNTGSKYHLGGCSYLSRSKIPISLSDAQASGYGP